MHSITLPHLLIQQAMTIHSIIGTAIYYHYNLYATTQATIYDMIL